MYILRILLFPFSLIFALITAIRNWLFNAGVFKSVEFEIPVIGIGNLRVGGTGKTPHVEFFINLLKKDYNIGTISRGYGRETRGFILAEKELNARDIGDEPLQLFRKFGAEVSISVCEDRVLAIPRLLSENEKINLVLLDDAFQHRFVKPRLNILLTTYDQPFYRDFLLPTGMLREPHYGARRADMVIVTKCPDNISGEEMEEIKRKITQFSGKDTEIFFSAYEYDELRSFSGEKIAEKPKEVFLISGLANSRPFEEFVQSKYNVIKRKKYPDHYDYYSDDLDEMEEWFQKHPEAVIICTEKDYVKLSDGRFSHFFDKRKAYYIPINVKLISKEEEFLKVVYRHIK